MSINLGQLPHRIMQHPNGSQYIFMHLSHAEMETLVGRCPIFSSGNVYFYAEKIINTSGFIILYRRELVFD